jgi:hypothetical protein
VHTRCCIKTKPDLDKGKQVLNSAAELSSFAASGDQEGAR